MVGSTLMRAKWLPRTSSTAEASGVDGTSAVPCTQRNRAMPPRKVKSGAPMSAMTAKNAMPAPIETFSMLRMPK